MTSARHRHDAGQGCRWREDTASHGQLAADWVGSFAEVVLEGCEDECWPQVLVLDSTSFWRWRQRQKVPAVHLLAAYGYDIETRTEPEFYPWAFPPEDEYDEHQREFDAGYPDLPPHDVAVRGRLVRVQAYPRSDAVTWEDFLRSFPGRPSIIVGDGAQEILNAVRNVWPSTRLQTAPEFVRCRWHLKKNLLEALEKGPHRRGPQWRPHEGQA